MLILLLAALSLQAGAPSPEAPLDPGRLEVLEDGDDVMQIAALRFSELEDALASEDPAAVVEKAKLFEGVLPRFAQLVPERNAASLEEFQLYPGRLEESLREIGALATQDRLPGAVQAFEELRNTCVSCHVKFRERNELTGLYPSVANTITGTVTTRDVDDQEVFGRPALVFLERIGREESYVNWRDNPALVQRNLQFSTSILPVVRGGVVDFPNDDTVLHNVFSLSSTANFDLGIYKQGSSRSVRLDQTGLVRVHCNLHPEMAASIVVLGNPYFSLTDAAGSYVVAGVPDGAYRVRAWNDRQAEGVHTIEIKGGELVEVVFDIREKLRPVQHRNKFGRRYPSKY